MSLHSECEQTDVQIKWHSVESIDFSIHVIDSQRIETAYKLNEK